MAFCDASPRQRCSSRWCSTGSTAQRSLRALPLPRPSSLLSRRQPANLLRCQRLKALLPRMTRSLLCPPALVWTAPTGAPRHSPVLDQLARKLPRLLTRARLLPRPRPSVLSIRKPWTGPARPTPASRPSRRRPARRQSPSRSRARRSASHRRQRPVWSQQRLPGSQPLLSQRRLQTNRLGLPPRRSSSRSLLPSCRCQSRRRPQPPPKWRFPRR